jgi:hypothetical protein
MRLHALPLLAVLLSGPALASEGAGLDAVAAAREARALCTKDGGRLWGTSLCGPLLLVERSTRKVVANQPDAEGRLSPASGGMYVGELPPEVGIGNTATQWAGVRWTMLLWPLSEEKEARARLLMHESWHRLQDGLGLPMNMPGNAHLDTADGRWLLQLEWRALSAALKARGTARREAVEDALRFRSRRRALFPQAAAEERALELNEGLAEYTGVVLSAKAPELAARQGLERAASQPSFVRSFAYGSGPAYGVLLDAVAKGWRKGLTPEVDLGERLLTALKLPKVLTDEDALGEAARAYGGPALREAEDALARARAERDATARRGLVEGAVLVLPLKAMQLQFDPHRIFPLGEHGTVYGTLTVSDTWGKLKADGGALVAPDFRSVRVPAPAPEAAQGMELRGEGWTLSLQPGWKLVPGTRAGDLVVEPVTP